MVLFLIRAGILFLKIFKGHFCYCKVQNKSAEKGLEKRDGGGERRYTIHLKGGGCKYIFFTSSMNTSLLRNIVKNSFTHGNDFYILQLKKNKFQLSEKCIPVEPILRIGFKKLDSASTLTALERLPEGVFSSLPAMDSQPLG